jgi:hypothetical protein
MTVRYFMQIGEAKSICRTHVQSWTLKLKSRVHTIKFSGFDQNLVRCLNMTVRYFMQIGEAKSICGTHVQSRTLELKAHA